MAYLEELLPEFRKGAKIRRKDWEDSAYLVFNTKDELIINQKGSLCEFIHGDIVSNEWELYKEPEPDWDYIIKNKCLCWFWDEYNEEMKLAGILAYYDYDNNQFRRCIGDKCAISWFDHCRPVRRYEVTFYEDRKDECTSL